MAKKIGGLGKGLSAIFSENDTEDKNEVVTLKISQIEPNRNQPRRTFDEDALQELALSISEHGVLQPILVRPMIYGGYQIVAGERRYRASRMAGLTEIPAIVRELTDSETMQIALIENLQRSDLTTLEEAMGYQTLMDEYDFSQEDVARIVGKSRSAVANTLRLLSLPDEVKDLLEQGKLSAGHARALLIVEDDKIAVDTARKIVSDGLSVRETEKLVKKTESAAPDSRTNEAGTVAPAVSNASVAPLFTVRGPENVEAAERQVSAPPRSVTPPSCVSPSDESCRKFPATANVAPSRSEASSFAPPAHTMFEATFESVRSFFPFSCHVPPLKLITVSRFDAWKRDMFCTRRMPPLRLTATFAIPGLAMPIRRSRSVIDAELSAGTGTTSTRPPFNVNTAFA